MKALFVLANLLMLTAGCWIGVGLFYHAATSNLDQGGGGIAPLKAALSPPSRPSKPLSTYTVIERRNLFNTGARSEKPSPAKELNLEELKETSLNLKLWGTVLLGAEQGDYAVIEDKKSRKQELYRVGDPIQNAVVKAILREKVVLNVSGKDEILTMEEVRTGAVASPSRISSASAPSATVAQNVAVDRQMVEDAMGNIGELMKQVRIRPYFENGQPAGLSLTGVRPDSIFRKMGIRSGDVLQSVDGEEIRSVDDVVNLYQQIGSSNEVSLQIKRRGRVQDITFPIRYINWLRNKFAARIYKAPRRLARTDFSFAPTSDGI
jgi:general secretion pathway protein C